MDGNRQVILFGIHIGFNQGRYGFLLAVSFRHAVIVILNGSGMAVRVKLIDAYGRVYLADIVVGVGHRDDRAVFHKYGQFPNRGIEVVEDTVALVLLTGKVVNPGSFGQVDAVTDVIAFLVGLGILVNRSHEKVRTVHELVLRGRTVSVRVGVVKEHGAD